MRGSIINLDAQNDAVGRGITLHLRGVFTLAMAVAGDPGTRDPTGKELVRYVKSLAAKLRHRNLAETLGLVPVGPGSFRLVSITSRSTLAARVERLHALGKHPDPEITARYFMQALSGLSHLHSHKITLGVLCPERLIIDSTGQIRISDYLYGHLHQRGVDALGAAERGPLPYLAPEVVPHQGGTWSVGGEAADAWSLGVSFMELLTAPGCPWRATGMQTLHRTFTSSTPSDLYSKVSAFLRHCEGHLGFDTVEELIVPAHFHDALAPCQSPPLSGVLKGAVRLAAWEPANRALPTTLMAEYRVVPLGDDGCCVSPASENIEVEVPNDHGAPNTAWLRCIAVHEALEKAANERATLLANPDYVSCVSLPPEINTELRSRLFPRSTAAVEDIVASTFHSSDNQECIVETIAAVALKEQAERREAHAKGCKKLFEKDAKQVMDLLLRYWRIRQAEAMANLRDRATDTMNTYPSAPFLFRTPLGCGASRPVPMHCWSAPAVVTAPASWLFVICHRTVSETTDTLESVHGHSCFSSSRPEQKRKPVTYMQVILPSELDLEHQTKLTLAMHSLLMQSPVDRHKVAALACEQGIPPTLRAEVWGCLLGLPSLVEIRRKYESIDLTRTTADDEQVAKDVPRCHQYHRLLGSEKGRRKLSRVLKAWVVTSGPLDASRYIQGMASLLAPLLVVSFQDEALAYALFCKLMHHFPYLQCDPHYGYAQLCPVLYGLIAYHLPLLWAHLCTLEVPDDIILSRLRTHFAHDLPIEKICLLWDALFLGPKTLVIIFAVALMAKAHDEMLRADEVTEFTQIWKQGMQDLDVHACLKIALRLMADTPPEVTGPPAWAGDTVRCAWIDAAYGLQIEGAVMVDTRWKAAKDGYPLPTLRCPYNPSASEETWGEILEKALLCITSKGSPVLLVGIESREAVWGCALQSPAPEPPVVLAQQLVNRGWPRVCVVYGHMALAEALRGEPAVGAVVPGGVLPEGLPRDIWLAVIDFLPPEAVISLPAVGRGLRNAVAYHQEQQQTDHHQRPLTPQGDEVRL